MFLHFCNSGESRVLFVQLPSPDSEGLEDDEDPCVSLQPPKRIMEKAIMFIKCLHASKLSREEISNEVVVTECFKQPLDHLKLITREVYLPLLARGVGEQSDNMLDMLHRLLSLLQTTRGNVEVGNLSHQACVPSHIYVYLYAHAYDFMHSTHRGSYYIIIPIHVIG